MKFVATFALLTLAIKVNAGISVNNPFYCYVADPIKPQHGAHSIETAYEAVRRTNINPAASSCEPSRFWIASRPGGRFPNDALLTRMINFANSSIQADIVRNYEAGRTTLCRQDFELIRDWILNENLTVGVELEKTEVGWATTEGVGSRYQEFFPSLLPGNYSRDHYFFRHTNTQRAQETLRAFADGLFGRDRWVDVTFEDAPERDILLFPTRHCPLFNTETAVRPEREAFENGPEFEEVLLQVNRKLGFTGANLLNLDTIVVIYEWCRFEAGAYPDAIAAWCSPFSVANNNVLEYWEDLRHSEVTGYGVANQRLIQNLNCGLIQNLLAWIQAIGGPVSEIYGTHAIDLQALLVTLGAFRDENLLNRHNFAQQTFRQWRTSIISPKAASLAVVRYDCADGDHDILFLYNERPLLVPGCLSNGVCKSSFLLNQFQRFVGADCEALFCSSN